MKTSILPVFLFHILVYVTYCAAAPAPDYFKLRVWNHPRAVPHYEGPTELKNGAVFFNLTQNYPGFDVYLDSKNPGMIRQSPSGAYGALIPTETTGLYTFNFVTRTRTYGVLTNKFVFKRLICGNCVGLYLQYDPVNTNNVDLDTTQGSFLVMPGTGSDAPGSWRVYWNDFSKNPNPPAGSVRIQLLR